MKDDPSRPKMVREPVQVYLAADDRAVLDRLATELGLSRAEVLRRGIRSVAAELRASSPMLDLAEEMAGAEWQGERNQARRHDEVLAETYRAKRRKR